MSLEAALKEARASAPVGVVIIETIELYHPAFVDDAGAPSPLFIVNGHHPMTATLEFTAPQKGGQAVPFIPLKFRGTKPEMGASRAPVYSFELDNVSDVFADQIALSQAYEPRTPIYCTVREFLSDNLSAPSYISPYKQTLTNITVTPSKIMAQAQVSDTANINFLRSVYTLKQFPGLIR